MNEYSYEIDKYIVGVDSGDEDGIVLTIATMENNKLCILRSCNGDNARFIDLLIKENQELKKQIEEKERIDCEWKDSCLENAGKIEKLENQQKEFIEYINSYIELLNNKPDLIEECQQDILKEVFDKYKEIIGDE